MFLKNGLTCRKFFSEKNFETYSSQQLRDAGLRIRTKCGPSGYFEKSNFHEKRLGMKLRPRGVNI